MTAYYEALQKEITKNNENIENVIKLLKIKLEICIYKKWTNFFIIKFYLSII